jgi:hypothetical protein
MNHDPLREIWNRKEEPTTVRIDKEWLLGMVRRRQREFTRTIFRRDVFEISIALLLVPIFIFYGLQSVELWGFHVWTWYLVAAVELWVAGFFLATRWKWKKEESQPTDPSTSFLARSIREVEKQIWLLRNIFWWYLLPPALALLCVFVQILLQSPSVAEDSDQVWGIRGNIAATSSIIFLVFWLLYWVNQRCVRRELEPRKRELVELRENLDGEAGTSHV